MKANLLPILFNAWKHHWKFIQGQICQGIFTLESLQQQIKIVGHSVLDVYTGNLSLENIGQEIIQALKKENHFEEHLYINWLEQNKNYQEIELSDGSLWTLLKGNEADKYIHIHPSRYSPLSIRSNANSLKTAILSMWYAHQYQHDSITLDIINAVRLRWLDLSPIRTERDANKIIVLLNIK